MPKERTLFIFTAKLFRYSTEAASWYFVATDRSLATTIKTQAKATKGFGSIPVRATVGKTSWSTSLFPDKQKVYLLPMKVDVRRKEDIREGDRVRVTIALI